MVWNFFIVSKFLVVYTQNAPLTSQANPPKRWNEMGNCKEMMEIALLQSRSSHHHGHEDKARQVGIPDSPLGMGTERVAGARLLAQGLGLSNLGSCKYVYGSEYVICPGAPSM